MSATLFGVLAFALAFAFAPSRRGRFGLLALSLASALCLRASHVAPVPLPFHWHPRYGVWCSRVAPVRGGTYFSLPPQRKVGKR
ncbi:hypothetical protein, partial [Paraburkholderia sp. SIMBA_054]|uniref:hypothetical protein n=1 Tax=Paraburkholderia sp. SIMBA_054 TaxID=3085795 RepID=UPI0039787D0C